jgi:hypothetical protein
MRAAGPSSALLSTGGTLRSVFFFREKIPPDFLSGVDDWGTATKIRLKIERYVAKWELDPLDCRPERCSDILHDREFKVETSTLKVSRIFWSGERGMALLRIKYRIDLRHSEIRSQRK